VSEVHHQKAKRAKRNRDTFTWDSTEGQAVLPGQKKGYSGSDGKSVIGTAKRPKRGRGSHTS